MMAPFFEAPEADPALISCLAARIQEEHEAFALPTREILLAL